jgi:hypothetical protein
MMSVEQSLEWELVGETWVLGENLPWVHFVDHKSHMTWPGMEPGQPRWEAIWTRWKEDNHKIQGRVLKYGARFLQNVGILLQDYTVSQHNLNSHRRENLKTYKSVHAEDEIYFTKAIT